MMPTAGTAARATTERREERQGDGAAAEGAAVIKVFFLSGQGIRNGELFGF